MPAPLLFLPPFGPAADNALYAAFGASDTFAGAAAFAASGAGP
jgi:hypothetical protein